MKTFKIRLEKSFCIADSLVTSRILYLPAVRRAQKAQD